jgi:prevent-host-death family protein
MPDSTHVTRVSSREFNQNGGLAKRAAANGPVIITDRGTPSHVLMTYVDYQGLKEQSARHATESPFLSVAEALSDPASAHIDLEIPRLNYRPRDIDLS